MLALVCLCMWLAAWYIPFPIAYYCRLLHDGTMTKGSTGVYFVLQQVWYINKKRNKPPNPKQSRFHDLVSWNEGVEKQSYCYWEFSTCSPVIVRVSGPLVLFRTDYEIMGARFQVKSFPAATMRHENPFLTNFNSSLHTWRVAGREKCILSVYIFLTAALRNIHTPVKSQVFELKIVC